MRHIVKSVWALCAILLPLAAFTAEKAEECAAEFDKEHRALVESLDNETMDRLRVNVGITHEEVCTMSQAKLEKALHKLNNPKRDHPGEALNQRYQDSLSEDGRLNVRNWIASREQVQAMQRQARTRTQSGQPVAGIDRNKWINLGPGNIGGRVRALAFDPDDANRIYTGSVSGGIWLSTNDGTSWAPVDDFMANLSISSLLFDPANSNVMYAGTGEGYFNIHAIRGMGVFKSLDKGATWAPLAATANDANFNFVNRLAIYSNGARLLAATGTGIFTSDDAGVTWTQRAAGRTSDVDVDPTDNNKAVAGGFGAATYSTDGGTTWTAATGIPAVNFPRVETAYSRSTPANVYASVDSNNGELYKSTDGGQTYAVVNTGTSFLSGQGWYDNAIWVDPTDDNHVIVGGVDLYQSTDGGVTLTKVSSWQDSPVSAHADHHIILEHPAYDGNANKRVYFGNDGGVYVAPDVSVVQAGNVNSGWQELNNQLSVTQFYGFAISPDGTISGGTQDNGTLVYKGDSEGWTESYGGDGGYQAADPVDANFQYGEYIYLIIHRSENGGQFAQDIYDPAWHPGGANAPDNTFARFIAPFILDPNNPDRLLGGGVDLWVNDAVKAPLPGVQTTWQSKKAAYDPGGGNVFISAIAVATGNSDVVYVGHEDGAVFKSVDGTAATPTWNQVGAVSLPQRTVLRIAIDPQDVNTVYASFGGYSPGNLWKSTDGGANWASASGAGATAIPSAPVRGIAIHPTIANQVFVGTEVGVFGSTDGGATWGMMNDGPANVAVDELIWVGTPATLYAATHGRGVFRSTTDPMAPNPIVFNTLVDAPLSTTQTSNTQTISGLVTQPVNVSVTGGEYSIGCTAAFTNGPGTVSNGDTICLRHTSSAANFTTVTTAITIGSSTFNFSSRTLPDITPDPFAFTTVNDVALGSQQTSNAITVAGISAQAAISVTGGEYSIGCNNTFTAANGQINLGQTVCVRHTASNQNQATVTTALTIGTVTSNFQSTTIPDTTADAFAFTDATDVPINTVTTSNTVTIAGIQVAVPISVQNGEYSISCDANAFTSNAGNIGPNATVCVRHTSSTEYVTSVTTTLNVNGVTDDFTSTTTPDMTPDDVVIATIANAATGSVQTSQTVTITGIAVPTPVTVTGGEYSIGCTDTFTSAPGTINNGETICLRHTASAAFLTVTTTTVTIGTETISFSTTTIANPNPPPPPTPPSSGGGGAVTWLLSLFLGVFLYRAALARRYPRRMPQPVRRQRGSASR